MSLTATRGSEGAEPEVRRRIVDHLRQARDLDVEMTERIETTVRAV